ncbi:hypothetical protein EXIGLDRAFT_838864 [Exidia glandulosa HHB12029]|uniref:DUF4112 domain-containing protein n=1 Tax=Exidia glandulosa HHB12029 TaxID=1314781 RepID=A0A165FG77_EXIGL|nr:hypothetical protein EXIGLDRAFT_838864 [Exidia glandulosa HHB12029]
MSTPTPSTNFKPVLFPPFLRTPRNPKEGQRLYDHIRTCAFYLDAFTALMPSLRESPVHVGLEPLIAASVPIIGPFIGAVMALYIVLLCTFFGVSLDLIGRMLVNIVIDMFAGWIPVIGPIVDVSFKANLANLSLLEGHLKRSKWAVLTIPPPQRWFGGLGDFFSGRSSRTSGQASY